MVDQPFVLPPSFSQRPPSLLSEQEGKRDGVPLSVLVRNRYPSPHDFLHQSSRQPLLLLLFDLHFLLPLLSISSLQLLLQTPPEGTFFLPLLRGRRLGSLLLLAGYGPHALLRVGRPARPGAVPPRPWKSRGSLAGQEAKEGQIRSFE